jgi:hypothetical protein
MLGMAEFVLMFVMALVGGALAGWRDASIFRPAIFLVGLISAEKWPAEKIVS